MDLSRVIVGPIVTEKSERLKAGTHRTYTMHIASEATKVDVKNALKRHYELDVTSVRVIWVRARRARSVTGRRWKASSLQESARDGSGEK